MLGIYEWHLQNPERNHYFIENVGNCAMPESITAILGEGGKLTGCAYGLEWRKDYRYWTTIPPTVWTPRPPCDHCKHNTKHRWTMCPKRGDDRPRPHREGYTVQATRNMIPEDLAEEIGAAFVTLSQQ